MSDSTWDSAVKNTKEFFHSTGQSLSNLEQEVHDYFYPPAKKSDAAPAAGTPDKAAAAQEKPAASAPVKGTEALSPAARLKPGDIPAPDQNGVLTISADSANFQKAIEQKNVTKLVIDEPGHVNFQVGLTTDAQNKPIFTGNILENQGGKIDKTFALPGNIDYVTINEHNKSADGKTDVVTSSSQVLGQGRLAAFKTALNSDQFYPGTFELKPVAGVPEKYPIPATAGTNDAFNLVRKAGRMNNDLLELGIKQFIHDSQVKENKSDPWFKVTMAKLDMLAAGKNLGICPVSPAEQQDGIVNDANSYLQRAKAEYAEAAQIAQSHLPDNVKKAHDPIYGQDPRNWHEIPQTQTGALDWSNPQADITYYGSALDLANYEGRQATAAQRNVNSASRFACSEDLDRLLK